MPNESLKPAPELVFVLHAGNGTGIKFGNRGVHLFSPR
jgi:hypothetical protein